MAKKKPEMARVRLDGGPYDSALFCPYCGAEILTPGGDGFGACPHLVHSGMEEDPEEAGEITPRPNDLCFVFFEPAPACREHYFVFREAGGGGA
jgi:hypothetical protein